MLVNTCDAQKTGTITIGSIPGQLTWYNTPESYEVKGNSLSIVAAGKTDMFRDPNVTYNTDNAPKLMFQPDDNFVLSASIQHAFLNKWDGGAIVLIEDSLNWIKFCFEKDYTGAKRVVTVVTKDISDDCNSIEITGNTVFYKMAKADNVITFYASTDGKNGCWSATCNSIIQSRSNWDFLRSRLPVTVATYNFPTLSTRLKK